MGYNLWSVWNTIFGYANIDDTNSKGKNDGQYYPKHISDRMFNSSKYLILPSIFASYNGLIDMAILTMLLCMTSLNYWYKPRLGWKRNIDIFCLAISFAYHVFCAFNEINNIFDIWIYMIGLALTGLCYCIGKYYQIKGDLNGDSYWHCRLHYASIVTNCFLYTLLNQSRF